MVPTSRFRVGTVGTVCRTAPHPRRAARVPCRAAVAAVALALLSVVLADPASAQSGQPINKFGTDDEPLPIIPGMSARVDILTGKKTILHYLLKPVLRAKERAFRER